MSIRFFHRVFFPDASVVSEGWVNLEPERLAAIDAQGRFRVRVDEEDLILEFQGVADAGRVICSLWQAGRMVTHSAVVPGVVRSDDADVLAPYVQSLIKSPVVQELTGGDTDTFGKLLSLPERPLCITVLIPVESRRVNDAILRWQERWVASYLLQVLEYRH